MRDPQRKRVYAAERAAFEHMPILSWREAAQRTRGIAVCHDIKLKCIEMMSKDSRWDGYAHGNRRSIAYPSRGAAFWVVLHEIAHYLAFDHHGPQFCAAYLRLVKLHIGDDEYNLLTRAFDLLKVSYVKGY